MSKNYHVRCQLNIIDRGMNQHGYIRSLDGVRAMAIILVMAFHAGILHFGWMGVQLFFVLSGYLITGILWKEKHKANSIPNKLKNFWGRRSLRIFPLYFGYLLMIALIYLLFHFPVYFPTSAPYLFTYTYNYTRLFPEWEGNPLFTHLWSLSIEEQFYLFYPFIIFFFKPKIIKWFLVTCILLTPLTRSFLYDLYRINASAFTAADAVYWNTLSHLDAFFLGGLIPVMALETKIKQPTTFLFITLFIVLVAGGINYVMADSTTFFITDLGYAHDQLENASHIWKYTILNLFFAFLILSLTSYNSDRFKWIGRFFGNKFLVRVGKVSYGMYIFHWAIFIYLFSRRFPVQNKIWNCIVFIPYLLLVYLVAEVSFRLYESKFLLLKDKFFSNKTSRTEANANLSGKINKSK